MIVRRGARPRRFTVVDNDTIEDERLTWEARGLLVFLLSKPDNWTVNREHLAGQAPNGIAVVRRVLTELEKAGYLVRKRGRGEGGRLQWEAIVYESPGQTIGASAADGSASGGSASGGERAGIVSTEGTTTEEQAPADGGALVLQIAGGPPPEQTNGQRASAILGAYMDWCDKEKRPRPARAGQAAQAIRLVLDAGWSERQVKAALVASPTVTTSALEVALAKGDAKPAGARAPVVQDRNRPSGEVAL